MFHGNSPCRNRTASGEDGAPSVYRLVGSEFVATRVEVKRRGREQAIIASGVEPGDRVATRRPLPVMIKRAN